MNKLLALIILIVVFTVSSMVPAGDNPFISKKPERKDTKSIQYPASVRKVLSKIAVIQHKLNRQLVALTKEIKHTHSKKPLFIMVFISFLYGIIHALGPGHGKTIIFSYFLSNQANIKKGVILGNLIAFLHVASASIMVLILYSVVKQAYLASFEDLSRAVKLISYALITLIGLFLLIKAFVDFRKKEDTEKNWIFDDQINTRNTVPVAIAVGMIPCPGAVIILLFSISMEVLKIGLILILVMAFGMAVTISSVGVLTIITKQRLLKFVSTKKRMRDIFQVSTEIIGSLLILFLGAFLFIGIV